MTDVECAPGWLHGEEEEDEEEKENTCGGAEGLKILDSGCTLLHGDQRKLLSSFTM